MSKANREAEGLTETICTKFQTIRCDEGKDEWMVDCSVGWDTTKSQVGQAEGRAGGRGKASESTGGAGSDSRGEKAGAGKRG